MIEEWAARIKLLILDVDGVLTDGHIIMNARGEEIKCFHVRDGHGLRLLMSAGIHVVIITGRKSKTVEHRARDLGIQELYQGVKDKESLVKKLIQHQKVDKEEVCCMGDDLPDLPMFNQVGFSIAVADACPELRTEADFVTRKRGGKGAVREVCELILKAQGKWPNNGIITLPLEE
ncbi:MAG: 3-deoxy-manno-octulosonate-8-phosphatase KdsC [Deltaproteobacteria bacterium]|nr:3-deoxy-manno-octulosonate-8-phosphatase KdsC [Deltaproteobacteria bacterium]